MKRYFLFVDIFLVSFSSGILFRQYCSKCLKHPLLLHGNQQHFERQLLFHIVQINKQTIAYNSGCSAN